MRNGNLIARLQMILFHKISGCIGMSRFNLRNLLIVFAKKFEPAVFYGLVDHRVLSLQFFSVHILEIGFVAPDDRLRAVFYDLLLRTQHLIQCRPTVRSHRDYNIISDARLIQIRVDSVRDRNDIADSTRHKHCRQQNKGKHNGIHRLFSF